MSALKIFLYTDLLQQSSVTDQWHFGTDPDPVANPYNQILLFSSVAFKMATNIKFLCLLLTVGTFTSVFKNNKYYFLSNE